MKLFLVWNEGRCCFEFVTASDVTYCDNQWVFNNEHILFCLGAFDKHLCKSMFGNWKPKPGECWEITGV